jgi:GxxExxY protein
MKLTKSYLDNLTYDINAACIEVHKFLGPGLLESIYHKCLKHELSLRNIEFKSELLVPINYKAIITDADIRCDLLIEKTQ